ncbi:unnamed protein product [Closterium sp. Yama58-4]|nr:unnamed protein product [Closterium sp. Yama58-4]
MGGSGKGGRWRREGVRAGEWAGPGELRGEVMGERQMAEGVASLVAAKVAAKEVGAGEEECGEWVRRDGRVGESGAWGLVREGESAGGGVVGSVGEDGAPASDSAAAVAAAAAAAAAAVVGGDAGVKVKPRGLGLEEEVEEGGDAGGAGGVDEMDCTAASDSAAANERPEEGRGRTHGELERLGSELQREYTREIKRVGRQEE